jgi:hypothetical protein
MPTTHFPTLGVYTDLRAALTRPLEFIVLNEMKNQMQAARMIRFAIRRAGADIAL